MKTACQFELAAHDEGVITISDSLAIDYNYRGRKGHVRPALRCVFNQKVPKEYNSK